MKVTKEIGIQLPPHLIDLLELTDESTIEAYVVDDCVMLSVIEGDEEIECATCDRAELHTIMTKATTIIAYKECECE